MRLLLVESQGCGHRVALDPGGFFVKEHEEAKRSAAAGARDPCKIWSSLLLAHRIECLGTLQGCGSVTFTQAVESDVADAEDVWR